jgi:hypothetical protein
MSIVPVVVIGSLVVLVVVEAFAFGFVKGKKPDGHVRN